MSCKEIWLDVVIPIVCALVSGLLTLIGVILTINHENKKDKKILKLSNKPFFYRIDPMQEYNSKDTVDYQFNISSESRTQLLYGIFKNSDNGLMFLNYISINGRFYFPDYGTVIDKNMIFNIYVGCEEVINKETEIIMSIKDVLDNEYKYKLFCEITDRDSINIKSFEEIKNKN